MPRTAFRTFLTRRLNLLTLAALSVLTLPLLLSAAKLFDNSSVAESRTTPRTSLAVRNPSLRPEALQMSRQVGRRFHARGKEVTTSHGTLLLGGDRLPVRITRIQTHEGETVSIEIAGRRNVLSWSAAQGAQTNNSPANGEERLLIERIVLDSPDQFVLAQFRGASYHTISRNVMPAEAAGQENYSGPLYDLVRVGEPRVDGTLSSQSPWRIYKINSRTGLIESVVSQTDGETVTAEFSDWVERAGERFPTRIIWLRSGETLMELVVNEVAHRPAQL